MDPRGALRRMDRKGQGRQEEQLEKTDGVFRKTKESRLRIGQSRTVRSKEE